MKIKTFTLLLCCLILTNSGAEIKKPSKTVVNKVKPSSYYNGHLRNPFQQIQKKSSAQYKNVILQQYPISKIALIGTIVHGDKKLAIIRSASSNNPKLYKVAIGMRIGKDGALISKIAENRVQLIIEVQTDLGIENHSVTMTLQRPKE